MSDEGSEQEQQQAAAALGIALTFALGVAALPVEWGTWTRASVALALFVVTLQVLRHLPHLPLMLVRVAGSPKTALVLAVCLSLGAVIVVARGIPIEDASRFLRSAPISYWAVLGAVVFEALEWATNWFDPPARAWHRRDVDIAMMTEVATMFAVIAVGVGFNCGVTMHLLIEATGEAPPAPIYLLLGGAALNELLRLALRVAAVQSRRLRPLL